MRTRSRDGLFGRVLPGRTLLAVLVMAAGFVMTSRDAKAQITAPRILSTEIDTQARLEEQLINRLRATREEQKAYIRYVVNLVENDRLETRLVVAVERYALRRKPLYAFPFFERALRFEAAKIGVALPTVRHFQTTADPIP
ncbi:MAG: hypothetical protein AAGD07_17310 [Planctomycetota bacterium]